MVTPLLQLGRTALFLNGMGHNGVEVVDHNQAFLLIALDDGFDMWQLAKPTPSTPLFMPVGLALRLVDVGLWAGWRSAA